MAQTIKLKRSSVSGNTPSTSDLELGEVAINTYDGKMFIKKNDGSDSIVEIGGSSGTVTEAFKTISVSGQNNVVADSATDTLTLVAGSNMTITTNQSGDTITFASSGGGGSQNLFSTFAVSGQNNVVADSTTDTLTFVAGSGITLTTDNSADSITIAATASAITVQDEGSALSTAATTLNFVGAGVTASGTGATKTITISGGGGSQNVFSNIGVSGQGTIQADSTTDTLTFEAGSGISLATDTTNDKLTITATGGAASVANAASSIKEFKYDITTSTTTLTGSDANSNTLAYEAGAIQVFLNGILLDPATDYTATTGTTVVLTDAAVNGDDVQILSFNRKIVTANVGLSTFTGDGTTTAFTLSSDPVHENNTRVHIDGVYQEKAAYSVSGTTLTFSAPPPNLSSIEVEIGFTQAEIGSTLDFADNAILRLGTGNDLQILHDGSDSIIKDTGTGDLQIAASTLEVKNSGLSETMLKAIEDGAVELYFDNSKKLETVTGGVTITGTATATTFSGDLSGTINTATTGTTQSASDNSTKIATTAYVDTAVTNLVDSAPGTLNTLNELAAALGDDPNFSTTLTNSLATKVGLTATTGAANIPAGTTAQRPGSPAAGQFRYNSTLSQFEGYTNAWGAIGGGGTNTFTTDVFTVTGATGAGPYTLTQAVTSPNDCIVHINGIYQIPTDAYTVSGTSLTFTATPATGRKIVVYSVRAGVSGNNLNVQSIPGDGTNHTFTLNVNPINENNTIIHIDGVYQQKSSYSVSGTQLTFGAGNIPANGTTIEVATFTQTEINVPVNDTIDTVHIKDDAVTSAKLGGNLVTPGTLDVNGAEFILDADADTSLTADTDDQIDIKIGGTDQIKLIDGAILPVTTNDIDLGSTSLEFKNAYFDGTVLSDSFIGPLTGNADTATKIRVNAVSANGDYRILFRDGGNTSINNADIYSDAGGDAYYNPSSNTLTVPQIASTLTTAAQTNITSVGTLTGLATSGSVGFRVAADSNYALKLLQSQSLTHGGYFQINGGTATGLEINANSSSYSGTALFVQQSTVATGGFLARFANSSGNKVTIETDGTTNFAGNVKLNDILAAGSGGLSLQTDEGTKRLEILDNGNITINHSSFSSYPTGSKLNVFGDGEVFRIDGSGATSRRIRFRNVSDANPGIIIADGSLKLETEDANTDIRLSAIRDIEYQTTSTNSTAGDHKFKVYNTEAMVIKGSNNQVKIGPLATTSATSAPLHVAVANQDIQAIFGDNNATIDDPSIRIIGRNTANSTARYTFMGLDADNNYGKIGYNAGAGAFQDAMRMTTEGYVQKPDQPYIRCSGNSASRVTNYGTIVDPFNNWQNVVSRGITRSGGTFTVPVAGVYLIQYSFYFWMDNIGHSVSHSVLLKHGNSNVQESILELPNHSGTGSYLYDNTVSNSLMLNMSGGDTFHFRVYADIYGGVHHTNMSAYLLG